ncbi:Galactokinase [Bienertia sinuspersici]
MCHLIGIHPKLSINYIQPNTTGIGAIITRATLLATRTFTAGFMLPCGINQETREAILVKASFLVSILADTYAMRCFILVLFFLMWSMVIGDQDKSLVLVDRCVDSDTNSVWDTVGVNDWCLHCHSPEVTVGSHCCPFHVLTFSS